MTTRFQGSWISIPKSLTVRLPGMKSFTEVKAGPTGVEVRATAMAISPTSGSSGKSTVPRARALGYSLRIERSGATTLRAWTSCSTVVSLPPAPTTRSTGPCQSPSRCTRPSSSVVPLASTSALPTWTSALGSPWPSWSVTRTSMLPVSMTRIGVGGDARFPRIARTVPSPRATGVTRPAADRSAISPSTTSKVQSSRVAR